MKTAKIRKITLNLYHDPSHSWLKAPRRLLTQLGLENKVTKYSYQRKEYVYLECDVDAAMLILEMDRAGIIYAIKNFSATKESKIKSYSPYMKRL